jgi:hypothetical protein
VTAGAWVLVGVAVVLLSTTAGLALLFGTGPECDGCDDPDCDVCWLGAW